MTNFTKGMIIMTKLKRYNVYSPRVHGRKWIGSSNDLMRAIMQGEKKGCQTLGCPCGKYEIYDNKLRTNNIQKIIKYKIMRESDD